ncbi:MAG: aldose 1-epimerase [Burkholderiaceae bacterium]
MQNKKIEIQWLRHAGQALGFVPNLGGGVAAWQLDSCHAVNNTESVVDLWRLWDGVSTDRYKLASFPMVPWSNRIGLGGFEQDGTFHPIEPNRDGEAYPIHGDGWLQPWVLTQPSDDTVVMTLESHKFQGNPYSYRAEQCFVLHEEGMTQMLSVTHLGDNPLPYGLGQHPWFLRSPNTSLHAQVKGVWLSGADPMPTKNTSDFPESWNLNHGINVNGTLVDNAFTGWPGEASIRYPDKNLKITMRVPDVQANKDQEGFCLLYRPEQGSAFCFEPVTHPIDAFHVPGRPGLVILNHGETLSLNVSWGLEALVA